MVTTGCIMVKIAITGTTGAGKTTLIEKIRKELESRNKTVEIVQEVARSSPWAINEDADFVGQRWVFHQQLLKEIETEHRSPDIVICDRSVIDNLCYMERLYNPREPFPITEFLQIVEITRYWAHRYDHIVYMPFNKKGLVDDGVRSTDEDFARDIDARINSVINDFKLKNVIKYRQNFSIPRFVDKIVPKKKVKKVTKRKR